MRLMFVALAALVLAVATSAVSAQDGIDDTLDFLSEEAVQVYLDSLESTFDYRQGAVVLKDNIATLDVPESFRYLNPDDTETVLVNWGNPPGNESLGMLFPADVSPFADEGWGVLITYIDEGHIEDDDAAEIDYDELLEGMQASTNEENEARTAMGYEAITLMGWAESPHYDAESKKLYWAKELRFEGYDDHTLNYDVRLLGRDGVLSFNAVAGMSQLPMVREQMQDVMAFSRFNEGYRYQDFNPSIDRVAAYGIGGLIAGKVAAKAGLFKLLAVFFLKAWKILLVGFAAVAGFIKRVLGRKEEGATSTV